MPEVDVTFTPAELEREQLSEAVVVAIDVLRATTTAVTALSHGASGVQPVAEPEEGRAVLAALGEGAGLLCGERHGRPLPGFVLGNSPAEYQPEAVGGKLIILTTTNGTRLLALCREAREVVLGALANAGAIARWLAGRPERVVIACAGRVGGFSLEDTVCAGLIVHRLGRGWQPTARAAAALGLYGLYRDGLGRALAESPHGRYLSDIGLAADLTACAAVDHYELVPRRRGAVFQADLG